MATPKSMSAWTVLRPDGRLSAWLGALPSRGAAQKRATEGYMSASEYQQIGNERARWRTLYKRGYRCVRVRIVVVAAPTPPATAGEE